MPTTKINGKLWKVILVVLGMSAGFVGAVYSMGAKSERLDHLAMTVDRHLQECSGARLDGLETKIDDIHDDLKWLRSHVMGSLHPVGPDVSNGDPSP